MEVAGLVVGGVALAGLYSACVEALERVESYRNFEEDAQQLLARFKASKVILQKWASQVGLLDGGLADDHDPLLDDPGIAEAVCDILVCLRRIMDASSPIVSRHTLKMNRNSRELRQPEQALNPAHTLEMPSRRQDKIAWVFNGKRKFATQLEIFETLVEKLQSLVSKDRSHMVLSPAQQLGGEASLPGFEGVQTMLQALLERLKDQDRKDFFTWLSPVDDWERYEEYLGRRTPGTCQWIVEQESYMLWRSEIFPNDTAKILWIHGPAGYGKSVLCAAIIKSLGMHETFRVIHYFCMSAYYSDEDSATVLRTWISQMVGSDNDLLEAAHDHLRHSNYEASKTLIWELFTMLVRHGPSFIFVIDGLDEYILQKDRSAFLERLWKVLAGTAHRVMIISRDEVEVRAQLTGPQARNLNFYEHEISPEDVRSDLVLFSNSVVDTRLANKSDAVRSELAEQLANKCDGMFLWIDLQRRSLRSWKNQRQLHQAIEEMPAGLESIYQQSWDHILKLPSRDQSRALKILRWVTFSTRPLTIAELVEILLVPDEGRFEDLPLDELPDEIDDEYIAEEISGLCRSLLRVCRMAPADPLTLATIQLRHFSIRQFILGTDARMALSDTSIDAPLGLEMQNNYMARACLLYLSCPSVAEDLEGQGPKRPFTNYAVQSWHKHISPTGREYAELMSILKAFFALDNAAWDRWCLRLDQLWKQDNADEHSEDCTPTRAYYAALYGLNEVVQFLHAQDANLVNHRGGVHGTPIKAACAAGHFGLVREISQLGADLNVSVGRGGSVLGTAASKGNSEICKYLLQEGARVIGADILGRSPIYIASIHGHVDVVKLLLDHGADLSAADDEECAPLYSAASQGHTEIVRLLLDRGADLSVANKFGGTPLHTAAANGRTEVVKQLLDCGADESGTISQGVTPFLMASCNGHIGVLQLLLSYNGSRSPSGIQQDVNAISTSTLIQEPLTYVDVRLESRTCQGSTPLIIASFQGHLDVVQFLLDAGSNISVATENGLTALHMASRSGYTDVVRVLLERGADVSVTDNELETPLHSACDRGHIEVAKLLRDYGAGLSPVNKQSWTPIMCAAKSGYVHIVEFLLESGVSLEESDVNGWSSLNLSSLTGHVEVVRLMLDRGARLSTVNHLGLTPLHSASNQGHVETVRLLLESGADVSATIFGGYTPLHSASNQGHVEIVKLLLESGADVSATSSDGYIPLRFASTQGHFEIVKLLLESGADVSATDNEGWTALHAASHNGYTDIVQLLIDRGANLSNPDNAGFTPLHSACSSGFVEPVRLLLDSGADLSRADNEAWKPIHSASYSGHVDIVDLLLDYGADPSTRSTNGCTPLHLASHQGHSPVMQRYLELGIDSSVLMRDGRIYSDGWAPICLAAAEGQDGVVRLLYARGASIAISNRLGWTALHLASLHGYIDLVKQLLEWGADASMVTSNGWTALHAASAVGCVEVAELLLARRAIRSPSSNALHASSNSNANVGGVSRISLRPQSDGDLDAMTHLGETSLHLACQRGMFAVAALLMARSADPERVDGYGHSCLDWLVKHRVAWPGGTLAMRNRRTPEETRRILQTSVQQLVDEALSHASWFDFDSLGYCLLFLEDTANAIISFQNAMWTSADRTRQPTFCDRCGAELITSDSRRYVCKLYPRIDLCAECMQAVCRDGATWPRPTRDFLEVTAPALLDETGEKRRERLCHWLREVQLRHSPEPGFELVARDRSLKPQPDVVRS